MSEEAQRIVEESAETSSERAVVRPRRPRLPSGPWDVLAVIAAGGAIGALARYGIGLAWPTPTGGFPWATLVVNLVGCALIGVLMVLITDVWVAHRLVRPFVGTGILGGFTTFSTYAVDIQRLITVRAPTSALIYLIVTPVGAMVAVGAAVVLTRRAAVLTRRKPRRVP